MRLLLVAAAYVATILLAASFKTISPVPRCIASLNVKTILLLIATPVTLSAGLKVKTVGATLSTLIVNVLLASPPSALLFPAASVKVVLATLTPPLVAPAVGVKNAV